MSACIPFGTESAVQFIRAVDLLHTLVGQQLVEEGKIIVAGDGEMMLKAYLGKAFCEVTTHGIGFGFLSDNVATRFRHHVGGGIEHVRSPLHAALLLP
jgi:hypothetical protein